MKPQEIKIGTRLEFEMLNKSGEKLGNTFISQLLEHQPDGSIVIYAPIFESRVVYVPVGITIRLTFVHHLHGLLGFKALVSAKEYRGNISILVVEPNETIEKIQRREHFRLDVITDVLIWPASTHSDEKAPDTEAAAEVNAEAAVEAKAPAVKAFTRNLSGSGLCAISETNFPRNTEVWVEVDLTNNIKLTAKCIILRNQQVEIRKGKSFELGMRFIEISLKNQDNLIKYIFEQQRMLLKKEK